MKLILIKTNLKEGLSAVQGATGESLNLPILKNVLFEAADNKIKLTTTNLEIAVSAFVLGKIIENGRVAVPAGTLSSLVGNLESDRLNIEKRDNALEIKTDNYRAVLQGLPAEDFPIVPGIKTTEPVLEIKGELFKDALAQVVMCAQASELRPELSSVLFHYSLDNMKLAATDSFRLAEKTIQKTQFVSEQKEARRALIPLKTAQEAHRAIGDNDTLRIYQDENQILFKTDRLEIISRLIDGTYPDYSAILPKEFETQAVLNREELIGALKLASVFTSRVSEVKIRTAENKKSVEVFSYDQTLGENNYVLPAKIEGKQKEISFNWRFLLDGLRALKAEEVFFGINEENRPAILKSAADTTYFYMLMPILKA